MGLTRICWGVPNHRVVPPSVLELQGRLAPTVIDDGVSLATLTCRDMFGVYSILKMLGRLRT